MSSAAIGSAVEQPASDAAGRQFEPVGPSTTLRRLPLPEPRSSTVTEYVIVTLVPTGTSPVQVIVGAANVGVDPAEAIASLS